MTRIKLHRTVLAFLLASAALLLAALPADLQELLDRDITMPTPITRDHVVASVVVERLSQFHFTPKEVTPALSARWFDEYFKSLDYGKMVFLQSDLDEFRAAETLLWNSRAHTANLKVAFAIYRRYLERMREWAAFSAACVYEPHDFSVSEYLESDTKERVWATSTEQLHDYWRRRVKNLLLTEILSVEKEGGENAKPNLDRLAGNLVRSYRRRCELESIDILEIFLNAFCGLFDPHSSYMAPDTQESFEIDMRLSLEGIGAVLSTKDAYVTIESIMPGSPAERSGQLRPGDRITAVAQKDEEPVDVVDMSLNKVVRKIRGPKGTPVTLTILPEGSSTEKRVTIIRDVIPMEEQSAQGEIKTVTSDGEERRILVITLPSFYIDFDARAHGKENYKSSSRDIAQLIWKHQAEAPLDGLILDLRGNGGGSLDEAVAVAGLFLPGTPVVKIRNTLGRETVMEDREPSLVYGGPMTVLIDRLSASASEIVAACLQDTGRAIIAGERSSHGKGTVQTIMDLQNDAYILKMAKHMHDEPTGSMKFTISKFYRLNGGSTQEKGVVPDVVFPSFTDSMELGESSLPNCLPWDEVSPIKLKETFLGRNRLPAFRQKIESFLQQSPLYTEYLADIDFAAHIRDRKQLPLEINARRRFQQDEERAIDMYTKFQTRRQSDELRSADRPPHDQDEVAADTHDIILEAVLYAMANTL